MFIDKCVGTFKPLIKTWVMMNESLNLYMWSELATHPFWRAFGLWDPAYDPRHPHKVPA